MAPQEKGHARFPSGGGKRYKKEGKKRAKKSINQKKGVQKGEKGSILAPRHRQGWSFKLTRKGKKGRKKKKEKGRVFCQGKS